MPLISSGKRDKRKAVMGSQAMPFWKVLTLLSGLAILMPLVIDIFLPAIPAIAQSFQVSTGDIQITLASLNLGAAIGQLLYGPLADRFGRRWVIIVSMSIFAFSGFATAAAPNLEWLNILRFVQGLTAASGMIIIRAIVRDLYDGALAAKMLAYTFVAGSIMPIAAPIIGGNVTVWLGWQPNFYIIGGIGVLVFLSLWRWLDETGEKDYDAIRFQLVWSSFVRISRSRVFLTYAYVGIGPFAGLFAILTALSSTLIEFMGVSPTIFGYLFALIMLGNLTASIVAGRLVSSIGGVPLIYSGCVICLLSGLAAGGFAWMGIVTPAGIVIPSLGFMIGFALLVPAATAGAMSPFPKMAGRASSLIGLVHHSAGAITSLLVGLMADGTHIPLVWSLIICGIFSFLSIWPVCKLKHEQGL